MRVEKFPFFKGHFPMTFLVVDTKNVIYPAKFMIDDLFLDIFTYIFLNYAQIILSFWNNSPHWKVLSSIIKFRDTPRSPSPKSGGRDPQTPRTDAH